MRGVQVLLVVVAPLRFTLWVLALATLAILVLSAIGVSRHFEWVRAARRREEVADQLGPVFSRFFESQDPGRLAEELRPAFLRMNAAYRPVAAVLWRVRCWGESAPAGRRRFCSSASRIVGPR